MNEIKYKKVWKDPGYCNGEFLPIKPLRGQVLNYWEMSRVTMPVRSYERYPVSKAIKKVSDNKWVVLAVILVIGCAITIIVLKKNMLEESII